MIAREDTEFDRLETSVVVNATMGSSEIGSVEIVDSSTGLEIDRPVKVPDEVVSLLELGCTVDVVAALKDVVIWMKLMAVVNVVVDNVCEELGCELKLLNSAELCGMLAGEDAEELGDKMVIDDNTGCDAEVGEVLVDNGVVDVATEKTAEVAKEVADVFIVDEVIVEIAELVVDEFGVEVATDRTVEVVDGVTGTKEGARTVESAIVDKGTIVEGNVGSALNEAATPEDVISAVDEIAVAEDDVGTALVETTTAKDVARTVDKAVAAEDSVGTVLEERLSALIMSAAFARALDSYPQGLETYFHTFSATPYTTACKCAAGITGKIPASTTLKFCVPTQIIESAWLPLSRYWSHKTA